MKFLCEIIQRSCYCGEIGNEAAIEIAESKETSDILNHGRSWPFHDSLDFDWIHFDLPLANDHSQVFDLLFVEGAFLRFEEEVMHFYFVEDSINSLLVYLFVVFRCDDKIIHIDFQPSLGNFFTKDVVHHGLKGGQ